VADVNAQQLPFPTPWQCWASETLALTQTLPPWPQVLFSAAPLILLVPCTEEEVSTAPHYECPLYRTPERRGVLATTGHSTK